MPSDMASALRKRDLASVTVRRWRLRLERLERLLEVADRFGVGRAADGELAGLEPALEGAVVLLAGHVVVGDLLALRCLAAGALLLVHGGRDAQMDLLTLAPQQRVVGRVANRARA